MTFDRLLVMVEKLAKDEISCLNLRSPRLIPRSGALSAAENELITVELLVHESCNRVRVWRQKWSVF
jgi:hypothetical protein